MLRKNVDICGKKFRASVWFNGKKEHLGVFDTNTEASNAYLIALSQIEAGAFIPTSKPVVSKSGLKGVVSVARKNGGIKFEAWCNKKFIKTFSTPEEAYEAYLKAKNPPKTFDDGLDMLRKLANEYQ